jgi:hypothetical protein
VPSCLNPLFIVGAPRSGTTLLQYILRSHPSLSLPTGESHFIVPLYRTAATYGDLREVANVRKVLAAMEVQSAEFLYTDLHGLRFDSEKLAQEFVAEGRHTMREIVSGLFEKNAAGEGKKRWGDKTPYYVLHLPLLLDWWPKAQFIHLIRDGRDVVLSMFNRRHDFGLYNTYCAAKEWQRYVEIGHALGQQISKDQYLEVRYEDLICDPRATLQTLCAFLREPYTEALLYYKKAGQAGKTPLLQKPLDPSNREKWRQAMSPWQIRTFEAAAGETLVRFGYPLLTSAKPLSFFLRAGFRLHQALACRWYQNFGPKKHRWTYT